MIQIVNIMMVKWKMLKDLPFGVFWEKAVVYLYPNPFLLIIALPYIKFLTHVSYINWILPQGTCALDPYYNVYAILTTFLWFKG